jgi:pimeloyl-ACP methyl ester carboxylesterase
MRSPESTLDMPPVLLLPGVVCTAEAFADQIADIPALHGAPVHLSTNGMTVAEVAANIPDMGPDPFLVIGFSMGGIVAMELLRQRPGDIAGACLVATNHDVPDKSRGRDAFPILDDEAFDRALEDMASSWFGPEDAPVHLARMKRMARGIGPAGFARQMRTLAGPRIDYLDTLKGYAGPTLIVAATHDPLCSLEGHRRMAAALRDATLVEVPGHHMCLWQQRTAVSGAIADFLDRFA